MRSTKLLPQQLLLMILGLSALVIPLVLITTNFNLVALFLKPTNFQNNSQDSENKASVTSVMQSGLELLDKNTFEARSRSELVVVLDDALSGVNYLNLTTDELQELVTNETPASLQATFKGTTLILVTRDIVKGQELATKLGEKSLKTALYLTNE